MRKNIIPLIFFFILPKTNSSTNKSDKFAPTFHKSYKKLIYIIMICDLWYLNLHVCIWIVISINVLGYLQFLIYVYIWHIFHLHYKLLNGLNSERGTFYFQMKDNASFSNRVYSPDTLSQQAWLRLVQT